MLSHAPISLGVQFLTLALGLLMGLQVLPLLILGALAGSASCIVREITQAEYRWIEAHGGLRAPMPILEGLRFWTWNAHSIWQTVVAIGLSFVPIIWISL